MEKKWKVRLWIGGYGFVVESFPSKETALYAMHEKIRDIDAGKWIKEPRQDMYYPGRVITAVEVFEG